MKVEIKDQKYYFDGEERFLVSGEFHYFRVPHEDWETRLIQLKEMYGNCVATYVPWIVHEETEGDIQFDDCPQRDLTAFLELCKKLDLAVIVRPGPYVYSELINGGIPEWVFDKYPEVFARRIDGSCLNSASYMHPTFLEKARPYYKAFADVVRPYLASNGGPIFLVQVDNELMGIHVWSGSIDYNPETCGFGKEDGRYAKFLLDRYGSLEKINENYNTDWASMKDAYPIGRNSSNIYASKCSKDMFEFYLELCGEYMEILCGWLREDGIDSPLCHNAANHNMIGYFEKMLPRYDKFGGMLLATDHYYCLSQNSTYNNPTPQYAANLLFSVESLRNLGMAPTIMEMPGGSLSNFPPILPEDLLAWYMLNIAVGVKGLNYYIYTGGINFKNTGSTADVYDYDAFIHADGRINRTYYAAQKFGKFLDEHRWLQSAEMVSSVRIAYEAEFIRSNQFGYNGEFSQDAAYYFMKHGLIYSLYASEYAPELCDISNFVPVTDKPLILGAPETLSRKAQENIIKFLENGGKLFVLPILPSLDENYDPCTLLRDYIGIKTEPFSSIHSTSVSFMDERVYSIGYKRASIPEEGKDTVIGTAEKPTIVSRKVGGGEVIYAGFSYQLEQNAHVDMIREIVRYLGAKPTVEHSNRQIFTSLFRKEDGHGLVFVMNLYSGAQSTDITVGEHTWKNVELAAMEVKTLEF